jgi:hypothetical protein
MKDSKNLVIGMLCAVVCIMAVAYAAFSTTLNINGTASISSSWGVRIVDNPTCTKTSGADVEGATDITATVEKKSDSLATINFVFVQPGDEAECIITYENYGTLDATLSHNITGTKDTDAIKFTITGTEVTALNAGGTTDIKVKAVFQDVDKDDDGNSDELTEAQKTTSISILTDATQKLS